MTKIQIATSIAAFVCFSMPLVGIVLQFINYRNHIKRTQLEEADVTKV